MTKYTCTGCGAVLQPKAGIVVCFFSILISIAPAFKKKSGLSMIHSAR